MAKRMRFSIRQLLLLTASIAAVAAFVSMKGAHVIWASKRIVTRNTAAFLRIDGETHSSDPLDSQCSVDGITIQLPTSLVDTKKIVRLPTNHASLDFEDSTKRISIRLDPPSWNRLFPTIPEALKDRSSVELLELAFESSSDDFSMNMSTQKLRIHEWAMEARGHWDFERNQLQRFARIENESVNGILIFQTPQSIANSKRLSAILYWESKDRTKSGEIWFGKGTGNGSWIYSVANSIRLALPGQEGLTNSQTMTDEELLSRVRTLK